MNIKAEPNQVWRTADNQLVLIVATGESELGFLRRIDGKMVVSPVDEVEVEEFIGEYEFDNFKVKKPPEIPQVFGAADLPPGVGLGLSGGH